MEEEMELARQQVSESAGQLVPAVIEATAEEDALQALERRVVELEAALGALQTVKASAAAVGRKTLPAVVASGAGVDAALGSLSVEQRIAVKSGLMRAGLL